MTGVCGEWEHLTLGDIAIVDTGYAFKSTDFLPDNSVEKGIPAVRMSDLKSGMLHIEGAARVRADAVKKAEKFSLLANDFVFGMSGSLGNFAVVRECDLPAFLNQRVGRLRARDGHSQDFISYLYLSDACQAAIQEMATGAAQLNISIGDVRDLLVQAPPLPEQKKIAAILTAVDDKLDLISRQIEATQTLKRGLMQTLFSRGVGTQDVYGRWISHTEFKESELGEIPVVWSAGKLDSHVSKVGSGVTPKGGSDAYLSSGIPLIRSQNVLVGRLSLADVAFISDEQHQKMRNSALMPCDVLLNITGASIGRCAILPADFGEGNVNQHVCIIRPLPSLNPSYLCHYLNSNAGQKQVDKFQAGGNREGLNFQQIRSFDLPVPPPAEQQKVAEILDGVDDKLKILVAKQASYESLKRGLMQKLLTGEWRVKLDSPSCLA